MFMKDLVSLAAGYDCMFMSFVSTVCTIVFARQGPGGMDEEVGHSWCYELCDWLGPLQPVSRRLCHLYHLTILPDTNYFHSNILCMRTGRSFLLKRYGEMGELRNSAVFRD